VNTKTCRIGLCVELHHFHLFCSIPGSDKDRIISLRHRIQIRSEVHQVSCPLDTEGLLPRE